MYKYFHASKYSRANVKVEFALPNYATKTGLKVVTGVDVSSFATKIDLASLKSNVYKLDIDKLKKISSNLNNLKSKVDKLDTRRLETTPVD